MPSDLGIGLRGRLFNFLSQGSCGEGIRKTGKMWSEHARGKRHRKVATLPFYENLSTALA